MFRATVRRSRLSRSRRTPPNCVKSGNSRGSYSTDPPLLAAAPVAAASEVPPPLPRPAINRRACCFTSSSEIRPPGPLPDTAPRSRPISRANFRTAGDAKIACPSATTGGGSTSEVATGAGAASGSGVASASVATAGSATSASASTGAASVTGSATTSSGAASGAAASGAGVSEAGAAAAAPTSETLRMSCPGLIVSPSDTWIFVTTPTTDDGTSSVAFSVSISSSACSSAIVSPSATSTLRTSASSMSSPSSGRVNSAIYDSIRLQRRGIRSFRVDLQVFHRLLRHARR